MMRIWMVSILISALLLSPAAVFVDEVSEDSNGQVEFNRVFDSAFDVVILRPLDAFMLVTGGILFVPAVLFSAPGGSEGVDNSYDIFVKTPWQDLVDRPLGEWGA